MFEQSKTPDDGELLLYLLNGISVYPEYGTLSISLKTHIKSLQLPKHALLVLDFEFERNMKPAATDSLNYVNKVPLKSALRTLV